MLHDLLVVEQCIGLKRIKTSENQTIQAWLTTVTRNPTSSCAINPPHINAAHFSVSFTLKKMLESLLVMQVLPLFHVSKPIRTRIFIPRLNGKEISLQPTFFVVRSFLFPKKQHKSSPNRSEIC